MSSGEAGVHTRSESTEPVHQTESRIGDEWPVSGVVNRLTVPNVTEWVAVVSDRSIETVMVSIDSARRLVDLHNETARTYFRDDQTVITTTTIHDDTLKELDWIEELDTVRRFGPDYHIPTEYSVYRTMTDAQQEQAIDDCLQGTEWMAKRLENHSIEVLVQAKGWLAWHFERCRSTLECLGTNFVVFYATGYENRVDALVEDLKTLISGLKPSGILLIGKSLRFLRRAPPEVVAVAGGRWRRESGLSINGHSPEKHADWKKKMESELSSGQALLTSYGSNEVNKDG